MNGTTAASRVLALTRTRPRRCPACGGRGWRLDLDERCDHCNPCCEEHFPSDAQPPEEQAAHVCPNCGWEANPDWMATYVLSALGLDPDMPLDRLRVAAQRAELAWAVDRLTGHVNRLTGHVNSDSSPLAPTPPPSGGAASPRVHAQPPKHVEPGDNSDTGGGS